MSISDINPKAATFTGFLIGFILLDDLTVNEQNSLGNFLELVGQVLLANASQQALIQSRAIGNIININSSEVKKEYNPFFYDINKLRDILKDMNNLENYDSIINALDKMKKELENLKKENN